MKPRTLGVLFAIVLLGGWVSAQRTTLDFNGPVAGTLADSAGQGVGFTVRLAGTGAGIPTNNPYWVLGNGMLAMISTHANLEWVPQTNLAQVDAPCVLVSAFPTDSIEVRSRLLNVSVPNGSDHAGIIIGTSGSAWLSLYVHELSAIVLTEWNVPPATQGIRHYLATGCFNPGDDVELRLTRSSGLWQAHWHNLTLSTSASSLPVSIPWLDANAVLSAGVVAMNTGTLVPFVMQLDVFEVVRGPLAATNLFGVGCQGSGGVPALAPELGSLPRIGQPFTLQLSNLPVTGFFVAAIPFLGFDASSTGGIPLPRNLGPLGMPGCTQYVDPFQSSFVFTPTGAATWTIGVPNYPVFAGVPVYMQAAVVDPPTNPLGLIVTNAVSATLGW